jgi:hypothetical protein
VRAVPGEDARSARMANAGAVAAFLIRALYEVESIAAFEEGVADDKRNALPEFLTPST